VHQIVGDLIAEIGPKDIEMEATTNVLKRVSHGEEGDFGVGDLERRLDLVRRRE